MDKKRQNFILITIGIVVGLYFLFYGLSKAQGFLVPLVLAILVAMLMLPVASKLESWGVSRGWASFFSDLIILLFIAGLVWVLSFQVKSVAEDWPKIKEQLKPKITKVEEFISDKFGISPQEQEKKIKEQLPLMGSESEKSSEPSGSSAGGGAQSVVQQVIGAMGSTLLTFVYIFFFLLYRDKFKKSVLKFFPPEKTDEVMDVINHASKVAQQYLTGRFILILILAILYSIGLSITGIKYAILVSVLAAVLSLIPYIGNIIGVVLALAMALFTGGSTNALIGVIIVFSITQFIESYILEPFIVGRKVDLNPVMTIVVVVLGEAVWGLPGMIIAIPVLGIFKIIFDHIPVLRPVGYTLGEEGTDSDGENMFSKAEKWIRNKISGMKNKGS